MTFDWDPAKSDRNLVQRGFDFEFASQLFAATYVEFDDTRRDYGERRVVALGLADGIPLTVVFTDRVAADGAIVRRIISARVSHRTERRRYAEVIQHARAPRDGEDAEQAADEGPR
ncbi:MAG: BrnT family toxin [Gemmatimonadaceae bacterium]|nr:BrnT family toxin [Gemmatimonadaceae bacterium]